MCVWKHWLVLPLFFHSAACFFDVAQYVLFDLCLSSWPCLIQCFPSPFVFFSLNHLTFMFLSPLYSFQDPSSSVLKLPWTTSPPLWATWPSFSAAWPATRRPLCAGWRMTPRWCRSHDGSPTDPRLTDLASASATWTLLTRATSSAWPPTPRVPCPRPACSSSNSVRAAQVATVVYLPSIYWHADVTAMSVLRTYCDKQRHIFLLIFSN